MAKLNLDLTNTRSESSSMFSRVPAGTYTVVLVHSEFKDTSAGGAGLILGYMVEAGEHKGKMIQDFVNIQNSNEKAVEIGLGRIKKIMEVQKRKSFKLATDADLINATQFQIEVTVEEGEYQGKPTENNKVKKILAIEGVVAATAAKKEVKEEVKAEAKLPWEN